MKTDIDIQDDIFAFLTGNQDFLDEISAKGFSKESIVLEKRKDDAEQIVISILSGGDIRERQEAFVKVNVFVKDKRGSENKPGAGNTMVCYADTARLRGICTTMAKYLKSGYGDTFRFDLDAQRVLEDEATHSHFVFNKLLYQQINL